MRSVIARLVLVAIFVATAGVFTAGVVRADDGSTFNPGDKRVNPLTGDKIAVYCNDNNIDVWGIDALNNGIHLTTFSLEEAKSQSAVTHNTPQGNVTLRFGSPALTSFERTTDTATSLSLVVKQGAQYSIAWAAVPSDASGSGGFVKNFSCTYLP